MLFIHFYLNQGKNLESWFGLLVSREHNDIEPTPFMSKNWQKSDPMVKLTAKHIFSQV